MANLDFEKHIDELERKITDLKKFAASENIDLSAEIRRLEEKLEKEKRSTYKSLTAWQRVQLARHPQRPYTLDYIGMIMTDFMEIHGDRHFGDDQALICGFARIEKQKILIMGHQKGRDTNENLIRNFGSAHPEGYRKAMRVMKLAEKFSIPIVTFIDTPGAYPGIGAEERGQAEAIAYNLREMAQLKVPIIVFVIGEGGSGGALGIGVGDKILVLENAYYSVISPEGCAAILWKERKRAPEASETLKLTAEALLEFGIIDEVVKEPLGGAHRDAEATALNIKRAILKYLPELRGMSTTKLLDTRYDKFRNIGVFTEETTKKGKEKT
ncbi:MAG: acetyl-CoA carboxylase carboxyltransferase subunit alpha [Candidatus Omnitrophica bacterium]|nr:acetyl-CoA carboxylase carboxyltransferase subunit alpha [Candidatus Omnitrophota bacterium]